MASLSVTLTGKDLDRVTRDYFTNEDGPISYVLAQRAERVAYVARALTNTLGFGTGRLSASIQRSRVSRDASNRLSVRVGSDLYYALWVEEGTGIYGPHRTRITSRSGRAMRLELYMGTRVVFAKSVAGQQPQHYLANALRHFRFMSSGDAAILTQDVQNFGMARPNISFGPSTRIRLD